MRENFRITYFGSPGEGYEEYPGGNKYSGLTGGFKKFGEIDAQYQIKKSGCHFFYAVHGLSAERYGSHRGGKTFGVGVFVEGIELIEEIVNDHLFSFLKEYVHEAVAKQGIIKVRDGKVMEYLIPNFSVVSGKLNLLNERFIENFTKRFGYGIVPLKKGIDQSYELDPIKIKATKERIERERAEEKHNKTQARSNPYPRAENMPIRDKSAAEKSSFSWVSLLGGLGLLGLIGITGYQQYKISTVNKQLRSVRAEMHKLTEKVDEIYIHPTKNSVATTYMGRRKGKNQYSLKSSSLTNAKLKDQTYKRKEEFYKDLSTWLINRNDENIEYIYDKNKGELYNFIVNSNTQSNKKLDAALNNKAQKGSELIKIIGTDFLVGQHK